MSDGTGLVGNRKEEIREGVTMALYIGLSLLAVLAAVPTTRRDTRLEVAETMFLTALGLMVAHMLAFTISTRLVSKGQFDDDAKRVLLSQAAGGFLVIVLATVPTVIFDPSYSVQVAGAVLLAMVAVVGYLAARAAEVSRTRALLYVLLVLVLVAAVLLVKGLVGH